MDLNAWITLLRHLRESGEISAGVFFEGGGGLPVVNEWFEEKGGKGEGEVGRLRQVVVHRWGYGVGLLREGVRFLGVLGDGERVLEVEGVVRGLGVEVDDDDEDEDEEVDEEKGEERCSATTTQVQFLDYLVHTLESAFHRFASLHLSPAQQSAHAHALELPQLAAACIPALDSSPPDTIAHVLAVCRALRNAAAHHNSFEPEAIQGRKDGGSVVCRYDAEADPYAAMARDAEMVAMVIGDERAAREVRLGVWVGDVCVRRLGEGMMRGEEQRTRDYLRLARWAERAKRGLRREDMGWEGTYTLFRRYDEAVAAFEQRAAEVIPEAGEIFGRWRRDVVGGIVDPRLDTVEAEWTW